MFQGLLSGALVISALCSLFASQVARLPLAVDWSAGAWHLSHGQMAVKHQDNREQRYLPSAGYTPPEELLSLGFAALLKRHRKAQ